MLGLAKDFSLVLDSFDTSRLVLDSLDTNRLVLDSQDNYRLALDSQDIYSVLGYPKDANLDPCCFHTDHIMVIILDILAAFIH